MLWLVLSVEIEARWMHQNKMPHKIMVACEEILIQLRYLTYTCPLEIAEFNFACQVIL